MRTSPCILSSSTLARWHRASGNNMNPAPWVKLVEWGRALSPGQRPVW